jgi:hypothetical protein
MYWPQDLIVYFSDVSDMSWTAAPLLSLEAPLSHLSTKPWSILDGGGQMPFPYNVHLEVEYTTLVASRQHKLKLVLTCLGFVDDVEQSEEGGRSKQESILGMQAYGPLTRKTTLRRRMV